MCVCVCCSCAHAFVHSLLLHEESRVQTSPFIFPFAFLLNVNSTTLSTPIVLCACVCESLLSHSVRSACWVSSPHCSTALSLSHTHTYIQSIHCFRSFATHIYSSPRSHSVRVLYDVRVCMYWTDSLVLRFSLIADRVRSLYLSQHWFGCVRWFFKIASVTVSSSSCVEAKFHTIRYNSNLKIRYDLRCHFVNSSENPICNYFCLFFACLCVSVFVQQHSSQIVVFACMWAIATFAY